MATYKEINGTNIQVVSSDQSNPLEGQLWYNTSTNKVKGFLNSSGSWATSGDLNQARMLLAGSGTQTAGLAMGGESPPNQTNTETYNGSNWTEVNDLNTARETITGSGSQPAALAFGGYTSTAVGNTELWNGTNWAEQNDLNTARYGSGGFGTTSNTVGAGGTPPVTAAAEEWTGAGSQLELGLQLIV